MVALVTDPVPSDLFVQLDREWVAIAVNRRARSSFRRWKQEQWALRPHADLASLHRSNRRSRGRQADPVLLALATLAADDDLAARVLLQLLLPGTVSLASRVRWRYGADAPAASVAAVWERIRTYPIDRRPHAVAANILLDARKRLVAGHGRDGADHRDETDIERLRLPAGDLYGRCDDLPASIEARRLLDQAVVERVITVDEHSLLSARHLYDTPAEVLAQAAKIHPDTIRRRWRRAEQRLRAAAPALPV
jgi:hypothetical protein